MDTQGRSTPNHSRPFPVFLNTGFESANLARVSFFSLFRRIALDVLDDVLEDLNARLTNLITRPCRWLSKALKAQAERKSVRRF